MIRKRIVRIAVPVAVAIAITFGAVGPAAADAGDLAAPPPTRTDIGTPSLLLVRWLRAVAVCSELYPPGTDLSDCIRNLY